jgi:hypothetical protein
MCEKLGLVAGIQKCVLLVDCWWGWLDAEFREWLKQEHPYVLLLYVPACCTPVGQPNDAGIIAMLKGDCQNLKLLESVSDISQFYRAASSTVWYFCLQVHAG